MKNSNHVGKLFALPFVILLNLIMLLYISFCNLFIGLRHKKIKKYRKVYADRMCRKEKIDTDNFRNFRLPAGLNGKKVYSKILS